VIAKLKKQKTSEIGTI